MKKIVAVASSGGHFVQLRIILGLLEKNGVKNIVTVATFINKCGAVYNSDYCVADVSRSSVSSVFKTAFQSFKIIYKERPSLIISTGALPGLIFLIIGRCFGVKTIWVDSVANPEKISLSGKVASYISNITLTQWKHLATKRIMYKGGVI